MKGHHKAIDHIKKIVQGMLMYSHYLEEMVQVNTVLTRPNIVVIEQLAQMTVTMNGMQAQLKKKETAPAHQIRPKRKYYCWSSGSNYTFGSKTCSSNKYGHTDEA